MSKVQDWDLNIYFPEHWDGEADDHIDVGVIRINPVLWTMKDGISNVTYSNKYIETTFAETRFIRSQYPETDFGYDWTDSLTNFLNIAPPRLHSLLSTLPDPMDMTEKMVLDLVG